MIDIKNTRLMKTRIKLLTFLSAAAVLCAAMAGCVKNPGVKDPGGNGEGGSKFDYSTTADVALDVDYSLRGNKALFEVYTQNPLVEKDGATVKVPGVRAILKAYTDGDSRYSGAINIPTAQERVWLYSDAFGLPRCVEVRVADGAVSFDLKEYVEQLRSSDAARQAVSRAVAARGSADNPYNIRTLGDWNFAGLPNYAVGEWHNGWFVSDCLELPAGLLNRLQTTLIPGAVNDHLARPTEQVNLRIVEDAVLDLVFVAEMAEYRNAIGYYYYDTNNPPKTPAELEALPKYVAYPNASSDGGVVGSYTPPLYPGYHMKLAYFDKNGRKSDLFPKGTTIGWFILPDGFEIADNSGMNTSLNITGSRHKIRYSNNEFNEGELCCMVSLYDRQSKKTVLGFEDSSTSGGDYKDVMFYIDATPEGAIADPDDQPVVDPDPVYPDIEGDPLTGTLAFEDLWPSLGDYDMNDVVIAYSTTFTTDKDNKIVSIQDVFTPLSSGGSQKSAFGYELDIPATAVKSVKVENGSSTAYTTKVGLEESQVSAVVMLLDDMSQVAGTGPITVTIELDGSVSLNDVTRKSLYNPFICVRDRNAPFVPGALRKEIHLTNYRPTVLADISCFATADDKSSVDESGRPLGPYYYIAAQMQPFAIDLPVTDYRVPDERVKIYDFYPEFLDWASSRGEKNKKWYLNPVK